MLTKVEGGDREGGGSACEVSKMAFDLRLEDSPRLRARFTPAAAKDALRAEKDENSENTGSPSREDPESTLKRGNSTRRAGLVPSPKTDR
jgi:hypothetical protein